MIKFIIFLLTLIALAIIGIDWFVRPLPKIDVILALVYLLIVNVYGFIRDLKESYELYDEWDKEHGDR